MRILRVFFALSFLVSAAWAAERPIHVYVNEDEKLELEKAQAELDELQRRIMRKEIPPIEFEFNSARLRDHSREALNFVADLLLRYPHLKLVVAGHTCNIGSDAYNKWLSQKRSESVKDYLVSVGVMGEFIRAIGYGESQPLFSNATEEGRRKNRRVEFRVTTRWWNSVF